MSISPLPSLPQHDNAEVKSTREFQLSLARTKYNYMTSYLEGVPLSADVPVGEEFSLKYKEGVLLVFFQLAENFKTNVIELLEKELNGDIDSDIFTDIEQSYIKLEKEMSVFHPDKDLKNLKNFMYSLSKLPTALEDAQNIPKDLLKMMEGIEAVIKEVQEEGPTALLKSTLYDLLNNDGKRDYLKADSITDYNDLYQSFETPPLTVTIKNKPWMESDKAPYQQDWFFGYLQTGGFNTTNLLAVRNDNKQAKNAMLLSNLLNKMPLTDAILQSVLGDNKVTLQTAVEQKRLYICDYTMLVGKKSNILHGKQRYVTAPIAVFYWSKERAAGYPETDGYMRPIAIQLDQQYDASKTPIFTPNDCSDANDSNGLKWQIAKQTVNICSAIQHENVAHLGACHLILDTIIIAANRELSRQHPILTLLIPHFRFTLNINNDALHNLIIPGGVTACDVGLTPESSFEMIAEARQSWRWDEQSPEQLFKDRGVDTNSLPHFEFRDDTLLLWQAIKSFVREYLTVYYENDDKTVEQDTELQGFISALVSPKLAGFKGLNGLTATNNPEQPFKIDSFDYLVELVSHIIYIAGPQHASVNYAQYPLMSFAPSVTGCIYHQPPGKETQLDTEEDLLSWCPPLDIALYTLSFEYLLSGVQYDVFGKYNEDPRIAYFKDEKVTEVVSDFQCQLAGIEIEICHRNKNRAMPYTFQLPSMIPNSTSI
ncbi:lipoxygenase family protein [Colwellia sp. E2M01]|uniref:lipoxygenase family protein n=1 Tax=Colwellia sp. E2M01 TaxID=2841561 RepID=UPI001C0A5A8A|nr:lipoxygenase family protein [Colwellia sp. E2M01]MBU2870867.1 arachidonate 15-lipoxygenase [Colwellia sp. E2M01]